MQEDPVVVLRELLMEVHAQSQATERLLLELISAMNGANPDLARSLAERLPPGVASNVEPLNNPARLVQHASGELRDKLLSIKN